MGLRDQGMIRGAGAFGRRATGIITDPTGLLLPRTPVHRNRVKYAGAPDALLRASAWYDMRDLLTTTQQTLPNRNNPSATAAQFGSTSGSDTNDPVRLTHSGTNYVYLPGVANNYLTTADSNALDIGATGDLEIVVRLSQSDWTPAANIGLVTKGLGAYALYLNGTTGNPRLFVNNTDCVATASTGFTDGSTGWLKVSRRASDGRVQYFQAADQAAEPTSWTQVGADVAGPSGAIAANTTPIFVGAEPGGTAPASGNLHRAIIRDGASTALDINPATETVGQASWTCTTGQTVTVNRATTGLTTAVVTRPLAMPDGTDDYIQLPATDLPVVTPTTGQYTALVVNRTWPNGSTSAALFATGAGAFEGLCLYESSGANLTAAARDSGAGAVNNTHGSSGLSPGGAGNLNSCALVFDGSVGVAGYLYGAGLDAFNSTAALADINLGTAPRVMTANTTGGGSSRTGEYYSIAIWHQALTAAQLDAVSAFLLGSYA